MLLTAARDRAYAPCRPRSRRGRSRDRPPSAPAPRGPRPPPAPGAPRRALPRRALPRRALPDRDRVAQLPAPAARPRAAREAHRAARPEGARQLAARRAPRLHDERHVDGLVRHAYAPLAQLRGVRVGPAQPRRDLLGRPAQPQLRRDVRRDGVAQRRARRAPRGRGAFGAPPRGRVGGTRPIVRRPAVARHLPRHGRVTPAQPRREASVRAPRGQPARDLFATSSRSAAVSAPSGRRGGARRQPPVRATKRRPACRCVPNRRPMDRNDSPFCHRAQSSSGSAADHRPGAVASIAHLR